MALITTKTDPSGNVNDREDALEIDILGRACYLTKCGMGSQIAMNNKMNSKSSRKDV